MEQTNFSVLFLEDNRINITKLKRLMTVLTQQKRSAIPERLSKQQLKKLKLRNANDSAVALLLVSWK